MSINLSVKDYRTTIRPLSDVNIPNSPKLYKHNNIDIPKPLSQLELSSGDIELTRCKSTVKAICFGLVSSANYLDE